jgi:inorganic triphosphatase YgiF
VTSGKDDHLETEQKYDAGADFVLPDLGRAEPKRFYLSATYFDTDNFDLIQHKITLRRRVGGGDEGWHLKLPVRQDTRQELHAPLDDGEVGSVPARFLAQVEDVTAGRRLRPVAILDTERTVVTVAAPAGDAAVEVADDRVTAIRLGETEGGPMTWREIEVEVISPGDKATALLESVGKALRESGARPSTAGSKLARVLGAS